jgi:hypothetical protein
MWFVVLIHPNIINLHHKIKVKDAKIKRSIQ